MYSRFDWWILINIMRLAFAAVILLVIVGVGATIARNGSLLELLMAPIALLVLGGPIYLVLRWLEGKDPNRKRDVGDRQHHPESEE